VKLIALSLAVCALAGCSVIAPKAGPYLAKGVNRYCEEPEAARVLLRTEVNSLIAPNSVRVTCSGDAE
jgi:hypothetical protein